MDIKQITEYLEREWDVDGFLYEIRQGIFLPQKSINFVSMLNELTVSNDCLITKRFVSLIWYLPIFLIWQRERVLENGGDILKYDDFITNVHNSLEKILGVP
ncbi:MAG: hypothetical protein KDE22_00435 [Rhodobacterales bacterium]|nr:hypothetical protein [Rhodobacterales bacterium]